MDVDPPGSEPAAIKTVGHIGRDDEERARAINELLDEALRAPRSPVSVVALLEESRR